MKVSGYMVEAEWDGERLVARGTNKFGHRALTGEPDKTDDVIIPKDQIADVRYKKAGRVVNGNLIVTTTSGQRYQLHFRHKDRDAFKELAESLPA